MKRIIRKQWRIKCPYCDTEFEYGFEDLTYYGVMFGTMVHCPVCRQPLPHRSDNPHTNITTERL